MQVHVLGLAVAAAVAVAVPVAVAVAVLESVCMAVGVATTIRQLFSYKEIGCACDYIAGKTNRKAAF